MAHPTALGGDAVGTGILTRLAAGNPGSFAMWANARTHDGQRVSLAATADAPLWCFCPLTKAFMTFAALRRHPKLLMSMELC